MTVDVASLCLKSGNAAILARRARRDERTNAATLAVIHDALVANGFDPSLIDTVDEYGREGATAMMEARGHIDVLIPRGGAGLIQAVVRNSKVPVIETGAGNVHIYVDRSGDLDKAIPIIINAKTQRVGVCNAAEKLLVHRDVAERFLPAAAKALADKGVELHADERAFAIIEAAGIPSLAMKHAHGPGLGTPNIWRSPWGSRSSIRSTRPSTASTCIPPATPSRSSPRTTPR